MKRFYSLTGILFAVIALITVSCEKTPEELLIGKWEVTSVDVKGYVNTVLVIDSTATYEASEMQLEFLEGGTGKEYDYGTLNSTFTWVVNGDVVTVTIEGEDPFDCPFTVNKSSMSFTQSMEWSDQGYNYKIEMVYHLKRL